MFKFLKDKLKQAVSAFTRKVEDEAEVKQEEKVIEKPAAPVVEDKPQAEAPVEEVPEEEELPEPEEVSEEKEEDISEEPAAEEQAPEPIPEKKHKSLLEEEQEAEEKRHLEEEASKRAVEKERREQEARKAEEKRKLEEEKTRKAAEEKKRLDEEAQEKAATEKAAKELEEKKRLEAEEQERKQAEEERLRQEAEEKRLAEEQERKKLEDEKKKVGLFKRLFSRKKDEPKKPEEEKPTPKEKPRLVLDQEEYDKREEDYAVEEEDLAAREEPEKEEREEEVAKPTVEEPVEQASIEEEEAETKTVTTEVTEKETPKKGFFEKIKETFTTVKLSSEKFDEVFWDLEVTMLENNVAVEVIERIKEYLKEELTTGKVKRGTIETIIQESLRDAILSLFAEAEQFDLVKTVKNSGQRPFKIAFIGVNGSGKTTTMAKVAHLLMKNGLSVVFAASDTFRAAAIQQLQEHADKLGVKMIKHDYESDPAAVAFDAVKHAEAKKIDVVLIDTAGRLHTNDNLMNELKKLIRVNKPDLKIFIGEAITGNDCVEQAKLFNEAVGIDAIILAKADVDDKGGAAISASFVTKKPIIYLGTGQTYDDLKRFDAEELVRSIGL
ncbi:signal recognition particle-docking protein FtsY [Candidatus Woesearchaeota archaeon]|nr:signal recognition particle-docking protein FtsY [Candidatus Woesearchaeota archaeon]